MAESERLHGCIRGGDIGFGFLDLQREGSYVIVDVLLS